MSRSRTLLCAFALAAIALGGVACSSDDDSADTTTTTEESSTTSAASGGESEATIRADKQVQQELYDVGCHPGAVDGVFGEQTDAAILAFQQAAGIPADGEYGPETQAALTKAVQAGDAVCDESAPTTTIPAPPTTSTSGGSPCTAAALLTGLPAEGETISSYVCADGYAAGSLNDGTKFILQAEKGGWYAPGQDPCGSASAGLPPVILEDGCSA